MVLGEFKYFIFVSSILVQTVPIQADSFAFRQAIKKEWWGIRDNELSALSGIPECVFVRMLFF